MNLSAKVRLNVVHRFVHHIMVYALITLLDRVRVWDIENRYLPLRMKS